MALPWGKRGEEGDIEQSLESSYGGERGKIVSYSFLFAL